MYHGTANYFKRGICSDTIIMDNDFKPWYSFLRIANDHLCIAILIGPQKTASIVSSLILTPALVGMVYSDASVRRMSG